jgi:hypothetical protein
VALRLEKRAGIWRVRRRPLESIAETQPQLQPVLLRLSAMISQYFITLSFALHTAATGGVSSKALRLPITRNNIITEIAKKLVVDPHAE